MAREAEMVMEMFMKMMKTEIAERRWRYGDNVPCANRRRWPNLVRL
jgi:hypothetical protein